MKENDKLLMRWERWTQRKGREQEEERERERERERKRKRDRRERGTCCCVHFVSRALRGHVNRERHITRATTSFTKRRTTITKTRGQREIHTERDRETV